MYIHVYKLYFKIRQPRNAFVIFYAVVLDRRERVNKKHIGISQKTKSNLYLISEDVSKIKIEFFLI